MATKSEWPVAAGHSCASTDTDTDTDHKNEGSRSSNVASGDPVGKRLPSDPLPRRAFFRLRAALLNALEGALCRQWNRRRVRLNKALTNLVAELLGHGTFAQGTRVALTVERLADMLRVTERTVRRAISQLARLPELVRVLRVGRGEPAYDGRPSRVPHLEWELGPEALGIVAATLTEHAPPGHGAIEHPDTVPPDYDLDQSSNSKFRHEFFGHGRGHPERRKRDPDRAPPPPPPPVECRPLEHPTVELDAIIEQHRRLADPGRAGKPIHPDERATVDAALPVLGTLSPAERLAACALVSIRAAADGAQQGRATLRYTFEPRWFAERCAKLREERETARRQTADAELTRQLWPLVASAPVTLRPPVPARPRVSLFSTTNEAPKRSRPIPLEQAQGHIAAVLAALDGAAPWAHAGGMSK